MTSLIRTTRLAVAGLLAALLLWAAPAVAQTTVNSTTVSTAITATQQIWPLASVTNITVNDWAVIDKEAVQVNVIDTTALTITVTRGIQGTRATKHISGEIIWTGPARRFYLDEPVPGTSCTATAEAFLPHITLPQMSVTQCSNSEWVLYRRLGARVFDLASTAGAITYTASGALTITPGVHLLGCAAACAMTLANPTIEQNGMVMVIIASTAQAHTVTYTAGFDAGTTARDVATYGGAIGDFMQIVAVGGVWYRIGIGVGAFGNVTLG